MANPTTIAAGHFLGGIFEATTTEASVALDEARSYAFHHTGLDDTGAAATNDIILSAHAAAAAYDRTEDENKWILKANTEITFPKGIRTMYWKVLTGGSPVMNVVADDGY